MKGKSPLVSIITGATVLWTFLVILAKGLFWPLVIASIGIWVICNWLKGSNSNQAPVQRQPKNDRPPPLPQPADRLDSQLRRGHRKYKQQKQIQNHGKIIRKQES